MVARKASWCHTGSSGTVAWEIDGAEQSLVLLWSIPFNNTYYANWLGAGITEPKHHFKADSSSFESLYYNPIKAENLKQDKKSYYNACETLEISDDIFQVYATMGTAYKAQVRVQFIPKKEEDLAPKIRPCVSEHLSSRQGKPTKEIRK